MTNGVARRGMPVWSKLPEPQRWQIVSFLKSLGTDISMQFAQSGQIALSWQLPFMAAACDHPLPSGASERHKSAPQATTIWVSAVFTLVMTGRPPEACAARLRLCSSTLPRFCRVTSLTVVRRSWLPGDLNNVPLGEDSRNTSYGFSPISKYRQRSRQIRTAGFKPVREFYEQNHKYLYMLYYDAKLWWGRQEDQFPDLKEITAFSVLLKDDSPSQP